MNEPINELPILQPFPQPPALSPSLASTHLALGLVLLGGPAHDEDLGGRQAQHAVDGDVLGGAVGSADFDEALKCRQLMNKGRLSTNSGADVWGTLLHSHSTQPYHPGRNPSPEWLPLTRPQPQYRGLCSVTTRPFTDPALGRLHIIHNKEDKCPFADQETEFMHQKARRSGLGWSLACCLTGWSSVLPRRPDPVEKMAQCPLHSTRTFRSSLHPPFCPQGTKLPLPQGSSSPSHPPLYVLPHKSPSLFPSSLDTSVLCRSFPSC